MSQMGFSVTHVQGIFLLKFTGHRTTVNVDCYCTTLRHLKAAIQMKHPGSFSVTAPIPIQLMLQCNSGAVLLDVFPICHTTWTLHLATSTSSDHWSCTLKENTCGIMIMWKLNCASFQPLNTDFIPVQLVYQENVSVTLVIMWRNRGLFLLFFPLDIYIAFINTSVAHSLTLLIELNMCQIVSAKEWKIGCKYWMYLYVWCRYIDVRLCMSSVTQQLSRTITNWQIRKLKRVIGWLKNNVWWVMYWADSFKWMINVVSKKSAKVYVPVKMKILL
jgi:hypothetical protein